jgi:hypothetical protein
MARPAKNNTISGGNNLSERLRSAIANEGKLLEPLNSGINSRKDEPVALAQEDTITPRDGKTGL